MNFFIKMNTCPCCKNRFDDEQGGLIIKEFLFCSTTCLFEYFTNNAQLLFWGRGKENGWLRRFGKGWRNLGRGGAEEGKFEFREIPIGKIQFGI